MCATGVRLKKESTKRGNHARQERGKDWASRLPYFEVDLGSVRHESLKGVVAGVLMGFWPLSYFFLLSRGTVFFQLTADSNGGRIYTECGARSVRCVAPALRSGAGLIPYEKAWGRVDARLTGQKHC